MANPDAARAYVGLGSNLQQPAHQVRRALQWIGELPHTRLRRHSRLYRTAPWGVVEQPDFVNAVAEIDTLLQPPDLLDGLLRIERARGRERTRTRWGPRLIDLDLLLYGDVSCDVPGLCLPHPQLTKRAFVLVPLAELAAQMSVPGHGSVAGLLDKVDTTTCVALNEDD
ncbi:MAG: 2-amino-4-hydroxy-6-hydroxymethyldihydropteridine diphosphokinase [Rhodanobacteraceae bacterium]